MEEGLEKVYSWVFLEKTKARVLSNSSNNNKKVGEAKDKALESSVFFFLYYEII